MEDAIGGIVSVVVFVLAIVGGIAWNVHKQHNCEEAGWEYHFWTEQCLPRK